MNALDLAYLLLAGATAPIWTRKARGGWDERLAKRIDCPARTDTDTRPRVLLHAVSVGEVNALRSLVPMLADRAEVVIATTTDTGLARAQALFDDDHSVVRFPLDFSRCAQRFLDHVRPDAVGLVELELWPNFLRACARRGLPVCVINGRLSERSFRGYRRARPVIGWMFRSLSACCVQDESYAERFTEMGTPSVQITGSMKWDIVDGSPPTEQADRLRTELGIDPARPLVVAGSTGPGEEALLHEATPEGVTLLCAPRKPERFDEAALAMPGCVRRSARQPGDASRYLLDTLGELRAAYALADLVVVGRSMFDLYGSDPIEPVALGGPTLIGPSVSDFAEIVRVIEGAGGLVRTSADTLREDLDRWLSDARARAELARRGLEAVGSQKGASERHARVLLDLAVVRSGGGLQSGPG